MKLLLGLIIILKLLITSSLGYEIKAEFENRSTSAEVIEGQAFDVYIKIWPFGNEDLKYVKESLEGKAFLDFFYIAKVYSVSYSKNNEEVMEISAKAILKKFYVPRSFYIWSYKSLTIPFNLINIKPIKNPNGKEFIIANQNYNSLLSKKNNNQVYIIIAFFITFCLAGYILAKVLKKRKLEKQLSIKRVAWSNLFINAESRNELENIYLQKKEWIEFVGGETPPILHFITTINAIQFKENWSDFEQLQVSDSFDEIRGMFERN